MNNEYIFLDEALRDRFMVFVSWRGISNRFRPDPIEAFVVELPVGLS